MTPLLGTVAIALGVGAAKLAYWITDQPSNTRNEIVAAVGAWCVAAVLIGGGTFLLLKSHG